MDYTGMEDVVLGMLSQWHPSQEGLLITSPAKHCAVRQTHDSWSSIYLAVWREDGLICLRWPLCKRHSWLTTLFGALDYFIQVKFTFCLLGVLRCVIWQVLIDIMWVPGTQINKQNVSITQILFMPCACSPFFIVCAGFVCGWVDYIHEPWDGILRYLPLLGCVWCWWYIYSL